MNDKIGVAISTYKRPEVLSRALAAWALAMPDELVVNHDRNGEGVAHTKNRGLAALMDLQCEHLFLADSDVWPISAVWWQPYVQARSPHLMHCWGKRRYLRMERELSLWSWPRGVLLYVQRHVVDAVGGMRVEFDKGWGGEHAEWSRRIHNAGFTTHPFCDAAAAQTGIWHCEDYTRVTPSTFPASVRDDPRNTRYRHELYEQFRGSTDFIPYA